MPTITSTSTFTIIRCGECSVQFALNDGFVYDRKQDHRTWYCPNGHPRWYPTGSSDLEIARRERQGAERKAVRLQADVDQARAEAEHQAAVARGYKGAFVQTKKRAAKGVCPVPGCRRHFVDVERHVASKHPDYMPEPA